MGTNPSGNCNVKLIPQEVIVRAAWFQTDGLVKSYYNSVLADMNGTRLSADDPYRLNKIKSFSINWKFNYINTRGSGEDIVTRRFESFEASLTFSKMNQIVGTSGIFSDSIMQWSEQGDSQGKYQLFQSGLVWEAILQKNFLIEVQDAPIELVHGTFIKGSISTRISSDYTEDGNYNSLWSVPLVAVTT